MIRFSVGYGAHDGFEDVIERHADRICEVYCAPPFSPSAAGLRHVSYEQQYTLRLHKFLNLAAERKMPINLLFDPLCLGGDYGSETRDGDLLTLLRNYVEWYGIASVTVSSMSDGEGIKKALPEVAVHASEAMLIAHPEQARQVAPVVDLITLDRDLNRDLEGIRKVKEAGGRPVQLAANMACVFRCVAKVHVLNAISHYMDLRARGGWYCIERFESDPGLLLKSTLIRPGDIGRYEGLVDRIKLDSLFWDSEKLDRLLSAYTSETYSGNLWEIAGGGAGTFFGDASARGARPVLDDKDIPEGFFEKVTACSRLCRECGYCDHIAGETEEEDAIARAVRAALR